MRILSKLLLLVAGTSALVLQDIDGPVDYTGYKVFRLNKANTQKDVKSALSDVVYSEWRDSISHLDILVGPNELSAFKALGLSYSTMHEDVGASITAESAQKAEVSESAVDETWFNSYHPYADHEKWLRNLQAAFTNNSEFISSGKSYQGRDIYGIHIWGNGGPGKPAVLWHGTVHAREWITTMVVEYLTLKLVTGYTDNDALVRSILDKYDFYILPVVNPDGFVFSQTSNRLWRKNRQPPPSGSCIGRDINRQWPYQWGTNPDGASPNPCDETYQGQSASDSPENRGLVSLVNKIRDTNTIKLYIDWHSYGQYILSPWGFSCEILPADNNEHIQLAAKVAETIYGYQQRNYTYGSSCTSLYATTGDSTDYIHGPGKSDWTYTIELRDEGNNGFLLPPAQILLSGREQWEAMKVMLTSL